MTYAYATIDTPQIKASDITVEPVREYPARAFVNLGNGIRLGFPAYTAERVAQAMRDALAPEEDLQDARAVSEAALAAARAAWDDEKAVWDALEAHCEADPAFARAIAAAIRATDTQEE